MNRKEYIIMTTICFDLCLCALWCMGTFLGPNLYTYDISSFVFLCMCTFIIGAGNHITARLILKCIRVVQIRGQEIFLTSIKGETFVYQKKEIESVTKVKVGYRIRTKNNLFRVYYNQDDIAIIVDGVTRTELLPGDFPFSTYDVD